MPKVRGGGLEEQPHIQGAAAVQEGREELLHMQGHWGFPRGSTVKNPPAIWVSSLGQKDPLEEEDMANYSCILAWRNSMDRGAW